jgi:hypothetical protein
MGDFFVGLLLFLLTLAGIGAVILFFYVMNRR